MMKTLYIIGGTMGVGKTTVSRLLMKKLPDSVFLDGDWCWDSDPFQVTDETKAVVMDNICHVLNNFIHCSAYKNIIFCWVMHQQTIIDEILSRIDADECDVKCISIIADPDALRIRLEKDVADGIRTADVIARSIARIPMYNDLKTIKIDSSQFSPAQVTDRIADI